MQKTFCSFVLSFCLICLLSLKTKAEIYLREFKTSPFSVPTNSSPTAQDVSVLFELKITRTIGESNASSIKIYAVESQTTNPSASNELIATYSYGEWKSEPGNYYESTRINGSFRINYVKTNSGRLTKIQAITPASVSSPGAPSNTVNITFGSGPTYPPADYIFPGVYTISNKKSGQALEIGGGGEASLTEGTLANQWPYTGAANQQWNIEYLGSFNNDARYKIVNRNSGLALEIGDGKYNIEGATINQWPYYGHSWQQWEFYKVPNTNEYTIRTTASNTYRMSLEIGGGDAIDREPGALANMWPLNQRLNQRWILRRIEIETSTRFPGVYTINNVNTNQVLEIGGAATNEGASVTQWPYKGTASQQWTLVEAQNGFYHIVNRNSGLILDVPSASSNEGERVQQWSKNQGFGQQWAVNEVGPGVFNIINRSSGQALEIGGDDWTRQQPGARTNQWPYWGGTNQHWTLTLVSQNRAAPLATTAPATHSNATGTLSVHPNPASTTLTLNIAENSKLIFVKVTDVRGAVVPAAKYQGQGRLNIADLATGLYTVTVSDGQREYHQKFVKQ